MRRRPGRDGSIGVGKVAEQREMQVRIAVAEEPDLEIVEERVHARRGVDDRRHDDNRPVAGRDAVAHRELWQLAAAEPVP